MDYVGLGGVFASASKVNKSDPMGLEGMARIASGIRNLSKGIKICASAGIDAENASDVIRAGADGIAVISALSAMPDPALAASELRRIVDKAKLEQRSA